MKLWKRVSGKHVWETRFRFYGNSFLETETRVSVSVGLSVVNSANNDPAKTISPVAGGNTTRPRVPD
jgi:hypothetical protein